MKHNIQIKIFRIILFFLIVITGYTAFSQDRLRPGIVYQPGEKIYGPRVGLNAVVPEGWAAILPQDTEMLLLMNQKNPEGSIYAFAFEDTMDEIKARWNTKFEVDNNIELVKSGEMISRGDVIGTELKVAGSTNEGVGYAEAKCSDFGWCVTYLLICPPELYDEFKGGLVDFMNSSVLSKPTIGSLYDNFDWSEFISRKYMATYISNPYVKKNNQVWFCPDGTFKSKIQQKGLGKVSKDYKGSKSGTYEVKGTGATGELILTFKKGAPVPLPLEVRDDKIYINGNRFYAMENKECK